MTLKLDKKEGCFKSEKESFEVCKSSNFYSKSECEPKNRDNKFIYVTA